MPIYAYRCDACGFRKDALQKLSDPALTTCPSCGEERFAKQLSAPAFQLKGTGWYVTDFRDNGKKTESKPESAAETAASGLPAAGSDDAAGAKAQTAKAGAGAAAGANGNGASGATGDKPAGRSAEGATPASVPTTTPVAKPSSSSTGTAGSGSSAS